MSTSNDPEKNDDMPDEPVPPRDLTIRATPIKATIGMPDPKPEKPGDGDIEDALRKAREATSRKP